MHSDVRLVFNKGSLVYQECMLRSLRLVPFSVVWFLHPARKLISCGADERRVLYRLHSTRHSLGKPCQAEYEQSKLHVDAGAGFYWRSVCL